jgi:hypothetical protein
MQQDNIMDESGGKDTVKTVIGKTLFDKRNPEMITKVGHNEVDRISILSILAKQENELRKEYNFENNILEAVIKENLVIRCSIKGWRAEQGEKIVTSIVDEEKKELSLGSRLSRVIRG